jgi:hypothetical protein
MLSLLSFLLSYEISGSHGSEFKDDSLLEYCSMQLMAVG